MIETAEIDALMESTAVVVREYFAAERKKITTDMEAIELRVITELSRRLKEIPAGPEGPKGQPGESIKGDTGATGLPGKDADPEQIHALVVAEVAKVADVWPIPKNGEPGRDGKDAPPVDIARVVSEVVAQIPVPKDGHDGKDGRDGASVDQAAIVLEVLGKIPAPRDGKDVSAEDLRAVIAAEVARAVAAIPPAKDGRDGQCGAPGKDGESIHPDTISLMVVREVERQVALIPKPKDGEPGRDAIQIDILPAIDPTKSYPRGTSAYYNGGTIRAERHTTPIVDGLEKAGWVVAEDGIASVDEIPSDDPREFSIEFKRTSGASTVIRRYWPVPMYEQIWREGTDYRKGAMVTRDGSTWHCNVDHAKVPPGTPNTSDWTLCVKRGQNGRDGKDGERGPEGKPGKDLASPGSRH